MTLHIIGNPVSPYVRKVLGAMMLKGLEFDMDPITPFFGDDEFAKASPLRRIPVLFDDGIIVNDSTIISEYLEDKYPDVPLYPKSPADRAKARWIEEYADSRMGETVIWGLFYQRVIGPRIFKDETDEARVERVLTRDLPEIMDWMEGQVPDEGFLFGDAPMVADLALAMCFYNAELSGWVPDATKWPKSAAFVARVSALECNVELRRWCEVMIRTKPAEQRTVMAEAGVPIWEKSHALERPRRGIMDL